MSRKPLTLLTLTLLLAACGDSPEKIQSDMINEMKNVVSIVKGVSDENSAKAAEPQLAASGERFKAMIDRALKLKDAKAPEPDKKIGEEMDKVENDLQTALADLAKKNSKAAEIVTNALAKSGIH